MYSVFQVIIQYCRQHQTHDAENLPVISQSCCATFLSTTIAVINEFKPVLKLSDQIRCDEALARLDRAQSSLSKHTEFDFDPDFRKELLSTLLKFNTIFTAAHTEMIGYHIYERLIPISAIPDVVTARAKTHRAFLTALFSKNADAWWENASNTLKNNIKACSEELQTYIAQVDNHRHLKRRAAIIMPSELIYDSSAIAKSTDTFDHETSCPGMAACGMLSSLIDGMAGLDENTHLKTIIVSRWFELNSPEDEKTICAKILETKLPDDVKKSLVFHIPYDETGNRDLSSGCAHGQGRFELRNHYMIQKWLDCTAVNEVTINAAINMLTHEINMDWSIRTIEMGSHVACDREDQNILRLLFFRFPRLEEIFTTHLAHLLEAAKDWQAFNMPLSPRRVPLSPIKTPPQSPQHLLNRTSPLRTRTSLKRAFEQGDDNPNESSPSSQNKHPNRAS